VAGRFDFYFKQPVTESELDGAFDALEVAQRQLIADQSLYGIAAGGVLTQTSPASLVVAASGPCFAYDQQGQRLYFPGPTQAVNVATDSNNVSTAVSSAANEKWISIFVRFKRVNTDKRVDGNSIDVWFRRDESYEIVVVAGAEAVTATRPGLDPSMILLGDVRLTFGQLSVTNASIDITRRQDTYVLNGPVGGLSVRAGSAHDVVLAMLSALNNHIIGIPGVPAHPATAISTVAGPAWLDAKTNPAADVQTQISKIVTDLNGVSNVDDGASKVGVRAKTLANFAYGAGSVRAALEAAATAISANTGSITANAAALAASIGAASGIAALDASARLAIGTARNGLIAMPNARGTSAVLISDGTDITVDTVSFAANAGDLIRVTAIVQMNIGGFSVNGDHWLDITDGGSTTQPGNHHFLSDTTRQTFQTSVIDVVYTVVTTGTITLRHHVTALGNPMSTYGLHSITALQVRP
jgi:hypothetical protein